MGTQHTQTSALKSLLDLPRELRLQIYDIVLRGVRADLDDVNVEKVQWIAYGSPEQELPSVHLPIMNLARSCRFVNNEVRDHVDSQPARDRFATISTEASLADVVTPPTL